MDRRTFLKIGGALAGSAAVAGCSGLLDGGDGPPGTRSGGRPPVVENRPDGVYVPSHVEGMKMSGTARQGDYAFGLMYSYAHRFWNVNGESVSVTDVDAGDDIHLMANVWDPETMTVLPETGLSVEIYRDGSLVSQELIYPMLSQPMGFHYGANFGLDGDGEYVVRLSVGALPTRRSGGFRDRFSQPATVEIPFEYSEQERDEITVNQLDGRAGTSGAVDPRGMEMMPDSVAPSEVELPGVVIGSGMSNDAELVVTLLDSPPAGVDGEGYYVAVSSRTRYNQMVLPAMGLNGTLSREGETIYDGAFTRTVDPELDYHYGAVVDSLQSGDQLTLRTAVQPQLARHEGYETAFGGLMGGMSDVTITVERS